MNSTGKELSQADLIRNYVLMGLEPQHQTNLYLEHWRPMEVDFGQEAYDTHFDRFMRHYLTFKTGEIPNINRVYESFKNYSNTKDIAISGVDALVADIHTFSIYYCNMVLGKEQDKKLGEAFQDIREFKMDVAYPFLLELYHDFKTGILSHDDFYEALRLVESYVFRRAVCNIPTNSLNKTFASFGKALQKDRYLESIQAYLITIPSYRRFPDDEEFKREFSTRDLYNFARRSYWLRRIENFGRKERVPVTEYTIEHILPQNESLSVEWQKDLGENWKRIQEAWLHTLGNLTLTGYNSEYSDRSFKTKRDMVGGFKESPLRLNEGVGNLNIWNEDSIKNRAEKLSNLALLVWKRPSLSSEKLDLFKKKPERKLLYSFDDHPYLTSSAPMRPLFEDFRKQVLTIDEVVVEEVLKLYIAYKAETNFVDVIPQAGRLLLSINIPFHEIDDPKKLCRNVKGIGRWGNGEVEVGISSIDELPYVMGLIRQAFEKQMGNGEIE
jgi:predicted transport protein